MTGMCIYPLPANSWLNIELSNPEIPFNRYEIIDFNGKKASVGQVTGQSTKIDVSNLQSGYYFIRLMGNNAIKNVKISIE